MDINSIKKVLEVFRPDNELIELRAYDNKKNITSGYFKSNYKNLLDGLQRLENGSDAVYFVFNTINDACYSKKQHETYMYRPPNSTGDGDIIKRDWIFIDADPKRPSGISSTDEEKQKSKQCVARIYNYLRDIGFAYPIVADSGNGYHLMYAVDLKNTDETTALIKEFLNALDLMFTDEFTEIDTSVFNASRITKFYGTMVRKGANTADRPHRLSRLVQVPDEIQKTSYLLIKKVADLIPKPTTNQKNYVNNFNSDFNIENFLSKHLSVRNIVSVGDYTKHVLNTCPFDSSHKAPDSMITVSKSGAIGFKCLHASCSDKKWEDVREMFEPKTERKKDPIRTNEPLFRPATGNYNVTNGRKPAIESNEPIKHYYQMHEIPNKDRSKIVSLPTGIRELDRDIIGLNKGEWTVMSGGNGSAKSTLIGQMMLAQINKGFRPFLFSGELGKERVKNWLHLQGAGRQHTKQSKYSEFAYYTPDHICDRIDEWMKEKFFLHNNDKPTDKPRSLSSVLESIKKIHEDLKVRPDIWYLDNLMSIDLSELTGDKYDKQSVVANYISTLAKNYDVHIVFVCHPRKQMGFLRKADISGTADLTNACDNVLMCHRVNRDFVRGATDFYGDVEMKLFFDRNFTNCIELMKNRDLGATIDKLYGLYFEKESKRLLNEQYENIVYGWQDAPTNGYYQTEIPDNPFIDNLLKTDTSMFGEV